MPSKRAVLVMRTAKAASDPAMFSPIAAAASLADRVTRALMAFSAVIVAPALSPSLEGGRFAAWRETSSLVVRDIRPALISSNRI